jgi:hypothetical protein
MRFRYAQENARRVPEDWKDDQGDEPFPLSAPLQMERFFEHHSFARKDQMDYPAKAQRDDTLLQMLGENGMAVTEAGGGGSARIHGIVCQCGRAISCNRQSKSRGWCFRSAMRKGFGCRPERCT